MTGSIRFPYALFIKLFLIWLSWKLFIFFIGEESVPLEKRFSPAWSYRWELINDYYRVFLLKSSELLLQLFGYDTEMINNYVLRIRKHGGVAVGNYCLGFQLMYYYTMLILISDIRWHMKIVAVASGVMIATLLNIIRIAGLNLVAAHWPELMFLSHDYIFNIIVFGVLMLFYYMLVR